MTEAKRLRAILCPVCKIRYKHYIRHVLTRHAVTCEEVMSGKSISQRVEDDERVALHVASCSTCKEALKKEEGEQ